MSTNASPTKGHVLIVDDEAANRKLLTDLVLREGYTSMQAPGGAEALALLASEPFDLVLLDIMMPRVDGLEVLAQLGERGMLPLLPVVVITAHDDRTTRLNALTAGAVDFLPKPIDRLELGCKVRTLVELKRLREAALARVEGLLAESDHIAHLRVQQSPVAKITWHTNGQVMEWNPAAEKLFGYSASEAIGQYGQFIIPQGYRRGMHQAWERLLEGQQTETTRENVTKDGRTVICEWHSAPLTTAAGVTSGVASVVLDVTEKTRLREALTQSRKLDAIGQLAGGIAHDFNNLLAVVQATCTFVRDDLPPDSASHADIADALQATKRGIDLKRQLLTFSRKQPMAKRATDLNSNLAELQRMLSRTVGAHIQLSIQPSAGAAVVWIDPVQFDQIVLNLVVNARDAMPNGGELHVAVEHPPERDNAPGAARRVHLRVTDTGAGMEAATQERIFEPFFTTKGQNEGTGLGLATCFGIVADAGGSIRVQSAPGSGTTMTVDLPLYDGPADAVRADVRVPRKGHGETVLVVEDDPALLRVTTRVLRSGGYTVYGAADGHAAIAMLDKHGASLAVVVSDIAMPGPSGYDVAKHAARVAPETKVLLTSGNPGARAVASDATDWPILWKPLSPAALVGAVAEAIAGSSFRRLPSDDLPAHRASEPAAAVQVRKTPRPDSKLAARPERVLLLEDDEVQAQATRRVLVQDGFGVVTAGTLVDAKRALSNDQFDVLVMDLQLPDGQAFELLPALTGRNAELPVVLVTGVPSLETAAQAVRTRVVEYLTKPCAVEELLRAVRAATEIGRMARLRTKLLAQRFGGDAFAGNLAETQKGFDLALPRIRMVFQPIVRAQDGSIFGYEALMRCDEPTFASPLRLLSAAELLGRVDDVGHVVRAAVAAALQQNDHRLEAIFVNLHPQELRADLLVALTEPLLPLARRIVLEVTERASLEGGPKLDEELARIRDVGYRVALDDLGEGYAGLASLVHLEPDIAKIDMSLVRNVDKAPLKRDIIAAIVDIARRSGIVVVAEGIETIEEHDTLVDLGCELLQGYLYAKPGAAFPIPRTTFDRQES
jgi:two-component system cell cycle sensor histidine kinase/response regulator CckA